MSRGKYSGAAKHRRYVQAEEMLRLIRADLKREQREHLVTKKIADEVEALRAKCAELRLQVELATSDEVVRLNGLIADAHADRENLIVGLLTILRGDDATFSPEGYDQIRHLVGLDHFSEWMIQAEGLEGREENREHRRNRRTSPRRASLNTLIIEANAKSTRDIAIARANKVRSK
jgi:hypothetical protein